MIRWHLYVLNNMKSAGSRIISWFGPHILPIGFFFILFSCNKDNENFRPLIYNPIVSDSTGNIPSSWPLPSIREIISGSAQNYSIMFRMIRKAGLDSFLQKQGPLTFFAVPDWIYENQGITFDDISALSDDSVRKIVLYQMVKGSLTYERLSMNPNSIVPLISLAGDTIFAIRSYMNGTAMTWEDIPASNGIFHKMSGLMIIPSGNILQYIESDTGFSFLAAAIHATRSARLDISSLISGRDAYTIFAPNNEAFRVAMYHSPDDFYRLNPDTVANLLSSYISTGRHFVLETWNAFYLTCINGTRLIVFGDDPNGPTDPYQFGLSIFSNPDYAKAAFYKLNRTATNGVIHTINRLLVP